MSFQTPTGSLGLCPKSIGNVAGADANAPLCIQSPTRSPEPNGHAIAVIAPASRSYDVVFDTSSRNTAGPFTFRLWINDVTPPSAKLLTPVVKLHRKLDSRPK